MYRPAEVENMRTPFQILVPTKTVILGVTKKEYTPGDTIFCSFKTFGGTEKNVNGLYSIEDTANIVTWFRPDIKSDCKLKRLTDGAEFEIMNDPENIDMLNQFLKFKIMRIKGGV